MTLDLDKLENLHQSTTPGPWKVRQPPDGARACLGMKGFIEAPRIKPEDAHKIEILGEDTTLYPTRDEDMAWIVAAHEAFPAMLAEIARLRAAVDNLNDALTDELRVQQEMEER
jgi:hypothetical protein